MAHGDVVRLLAPSYINVPNVYAVSDMFAHQLAMIDPDGRSLQVSMNGYELTRSPIINSYVSWGTKEDDGLGRYQDEQTGRTRSRWWCRRPRRTSTQRTRTIYVLSMKLPKEETVDASTAQEDYYCNSQTMCAASPPYSRYY